ncbi:unnamed protein product [Gongylonema pulchrum]|uniref:PUL domain-containing protein n=1 Tax=Gongylonema pulchrum TaxID=637853 RepID=A0A183DSS4_9BILA|nr:unnamed protein product [Gongylonema pulchrum]
MNCFKASDKTVITLKDLTEAIAERSCNCAQNSEILKKGDEHLRLLLKISSVRIVSTLQNLAHHVNAYFFGSYAEYKVVILDVALAVSVTVVKFTIYDIVTV